MRLLWSACCGMLLLAGCATTRVSQAPLATAAQEQVLRGLAGFQLEGRASIKVGDDGFTPSLSWQQRADEARLRVHPPIGPGGLTLVYSPQLLQVTDSRANTYEGDDARNLLASQLGFVPPFDALRYWVLGLAAPGESPVASVLDGEGRAIEMTQQGWHIKYDRWTTEATRAGTLRLPKRLTASRADLRLVLFVDRWKLRVAD
jgi:outer membrane lipoprotein LolB